MLLTRIQGASGRIAKQIIQEMDVILGPEGARQSDRALRDTRPTRSSDEANARIGILLQGSEPFLVARLGSIELEVAKNLRKMALLQESKQQFARLPKAAWIRARHRYAVRKLENNSGFFPVTEQNIDRFAKLLIRSMAHVDMLGSWVRGEGYFRDELRGCEICNLCDIEPYFHQSPWSQFLEGKCVLVIHPFAQTIRLQYEQKRTKLFEHGLVLPRFRLLTLAAVQSIAGNRPRAHKDWFSALKYMYMEALSSEASVVLLGCGSYGFPLAAMLKAAGRQVIHLGGCTQILFGIKGRRWDNDPRVSALYNEHWVRPAKEERPAGADKVEHACYW